MIERICDWIWGPKLSIDDPLFGNLVTQRIKGRGRPVGDPPEYAWIANPLRNPWAELDQVIIHGDVNGPNDSHRNGWTKLLSKSDEFQAVLAKKLFENYEWNKQHLIAGCIESYGDDDLSRFKHWPHYENAKDIYDRNRVDWWLDIYCDERLEFYISTDWDEEHNFRVYVQDGKLVDAGQD